MFSPCPQVALECELELMKGFEGWRVQDECDPVIIRVMARMISRTEDLTFSPGAASQERK
jgi:hypothetical protein